MSILDKFTLDKKVAVVTGAAQGLGKGYAKGLADAGATVVCCDINLDGVTLTANEILSSGGKATPAMLNVAKPDMCNEVFQSIAAKYGHLDILVNNAGVEEINGFVNVTESQYDKITGVNLRGAFFTAQAAARIMQKQQSGKILNVGSLGSAIGLAESSVYCTAKSGIMGLTRTMAVELSKSNIQVNAIGPGYFRTPMTEPFFQDPKHKKWIEEKIPLGRVGNVDDLLGTVIFLCSSASDYISGQIVYVDGGWLAS